MLILRFAARMFSVVLMMLVAGAVYGQDYPNKPIRLITGTAGSGADVMARLLAQAISGPLGQPVIVDNRTGTLAGEAVAKAPPDGYTLTVNGQSLWVGPLIQKAPYDMMKDFAPVSLLVRYVYVLAVHPSVPVKSVRELIALARANPGQLNYGSSTIGGPAQLGSELFKSMAGVKIVGVPYKGNGPVMTALIIGEVQMTIIDAGLVLPYVKPGRLRALAVTSPEPSALAPGLTTVAESGLPGYNLVGTGVVIAPAKTPAAVINRLHQEISRALNLPEVKERLLVSGAEVVAGSPDQLAAVIKSDIVRMSKVIKDAGIKVEY